MATRVTTIRLAAFIALVAMGSLAGAALACDGHSKSASASGACCASKMHSTTACVTPAAKPAAKSAYVPLPSKSAPVATSAFPSLPVFTTQQEPIVSGLMAFIDPETGMIGGSITDLRVPDDLARSFAAPVELTPITFPDGSVMIDLQGTLQDYYVLTIDPLGHRSVRCVPDARKALAPAAPILLPISER